MHVVLRSKMRVLYVYLCVCLSLGVVDKPCIVIPPSFVAVFTAVLGSHLRACIIIVHRYVDWFMALAVPWTAVQPHELTWGLDSDLVSLIDEAYLAAAPASPWSPLSDLYCFNNDELGADEMSTPEKEEGETTTTAEESQSDTEVPAPPPPPPKTPPKKKTRRSPRRVSSPTGSADPGTSSQPEMQALSQPQPGAHAGRELLPLRKNVDRHRARVRAALQKVFPDADNPQVHTAGWNLQHKHQRFNRTGYQITEEQSLQLQSKMAGEKRELPQQYVPLFKIYTWEQQVARFNRVQQKPHCFEGMVGSEYAAAAHVFHQPSCSAAAAIVPL